MRGVYTVAAKITGLSAAKTLFYVTAPATAALEILSASVTAESNATNFQWQVAFYRVTSLGTPTATAATPSPHENGDQASAATAKVNVTASEPTYAGTPVWMEGSASLAGWRFEPLSPDERIVVPPSGTIGLRMITTPTSGDVDVRVTWREIG